MAGSQDRTTARLPLRQLGDPRIHMERLFFLSGHLQFRLCLNRTPGRLSLVGDKFVSGEAKPNDIDGVAHVPR